MRALLLLLVCVSVAHAKPARWQTLPLPPAMPAATSTGTVTVGSARIYYATYGKGTPLILLHGGMGNSDHFGFQLPALVDTFRVITIDSRGHGRSTLGKAKLSYHAMAADVLAVMDHLEVKRAAFAGWSDGGAIALDLAVHHPARVSKVFVIGTNYSASGNKPRRGKPPATTFSKYTAKCRTDHARMNPRPKSFNALVAALLPVWRRPGGFTHDDLKSIKAPTMVALGDHDEIIETAHTEEMADLIPKGDFLVLENASHFAMWQAPDDFNRALIAFLTAN